MAMLKLSQSYSGGVTVKPYTGNIAQELQFLTGEKKNQPHFKTSNYNTVPGALNLVSALLQYKIIRKIAIITAASNR